MRLTAEEIQALLAPFDPDEETLQEELKPLINDRLLRIIASADYGAEAQEHFLELLSIRDTGVIPAPLKWNPREVLELIRWSEPENPKWKPGLTGTEGHLIRAFSCGVLIRAGGIKENIPYIDGENETVIQLVDSALKLGPEFSRAALQLFCWRMLQPEMSDVNMEERPFFAMAILLLAVSLYRKEEDGPMLRKLGEWVIEEENEGSREVLQYYASGVPHRWLTGLAIYFNLKENNWIEVSRRVLLNPPTPHPGEADEVLRLIGNIIE